MLMRQIKSKLGEVSMTSQTMYVDFESHRPYCDDCSNSLVDEGWSFLEVHLNSPKDVLTCVHCDKVISVTVRRARTK